MINVIEDWLLLQGFAPSAASLTLSARGIGRSRSPPRPRALQRAKRRAE